MTVAAPRLALGIDAGGTQTRWALAGADGAIVAEGRIAGMSAARMSNAEGRADVHGLLAALAQQVLAAGRPQAVCAGVTGFGGDGALLTEWLAAMLSVEHGAVTLSSDIEIAFHDSFAPGEGYLVYAGTGSIAAWIDGAGEFHRAGGRGVALDDGGGGYWIAREALRHIWRCEDEAPGAWQQSPMARAVFDHVGGSDWSFTRQFMNTQDRGAVGMLALAVAATADTDPAARQILEHAGRELARIAQALVSRFGARPIVLAGRAASLHPLIAASMGAALAPLRVQQKAIQAHHAAARLALHSCQ
jgi:N-acetylglucosamine kinase-like BadF-type ATPase